MPGLKVSPACPHCGKNVPSSWRCAQASDTGPRDWRPRPSDFRLPSVTLEELEDEDAPGYRGGSPRRNPNAILEEVDDEEVVDAPEVEMRPASRGQSEDAHEAEGIPAQELPYHGPHPFANPTRPGLFPEPHPDRTAGVPLEYCEVDRDAPPKYTSVLAEPDVFREAYWLDHLPICRDDESEFFSLPRTHGWFCKNLTEFEQEVNRLPRGPHWYRETILVTGDQDDEILDLWKRDIIELILVPIIILTDKTKLTVFSGNQKAWPVYLSIGNISSDICRCPSEHAMLLIGFIPVSNLSNISNRSDRSEAGWQLFHTCLESILEPLKILSRTGIEILCADGGVHRVFPILAAYIADSPEQATVACVCESCCPVCWIPSNKRGNLSVRYPLRDRRRTCDALNDCWNGYSRTINTLGIRPTRPFWADLPYVEISTCFTPDLLHQLDKGVFGDHIVSWTKAMLGTNEMDRRTKGMPRFHDLRHFSRGISVISMWTGKEAKALSHTFMSIVAGTGRPMLVAAAKSILNFMFRARRPELSEADLRTMEQDLLAFNEVKSVFVDPNNRLLLSHERRFHSFIKFHSLTHYRYFIRELGSPRGFTTEITERLHIDYVKKPWSTTNHVNPTQQMIAHLQNREAWALLRAYMHDAGLVIDQRFRNEHKDVGGGEDEGPDDVVQDGDDDDGSGVWEPSPSIGIAKRPSLGANVRGAYLIKKHNAPDLIPATIDYLESVVPAGTSIPISYNTVFKVWTRCKLHHPPLPFDPALGPRTDQLRAFTTSSDLEGRVLRQGFFDVVLFSPRTPPANLQGLQLGRVRAIFALPNHHGSLSSEPLVYIERFRPFGTRPSSSTSLYPTQHAFYNGRRSAVVLPLSQRMRHLVLQQERMAGSRAIPSYGQPHTAAFMDLVWFIDNGKVQALTARFIMSTSDSDEECGPGHETRDMTSTGRSIQDIRLQQIESEQRRHNNLRSGFARLKDALPTSYKKCSKVVLLERDGQTERVNQTVEHYLRAFVSHKQDDWVKWLSTAEFSYNNASHSATGTSPFYALYGRHPSITPTGETTSMPAADEHIKQLKQVQNEVLSSLHMAKERMKAANNSTLPDYKVGDKVWLDAKNIETQRPSKKLDHQRLGPFKIAEQISPAAYRLELPASMNS
ncbi:hypothetical protein RhiJN_28962 [Ceratobasidium sp. AG-Ba]|nr:hypothetical protein RhiJN_28962 [Ceratobasidium sp. AG-Ba]